MKSVFINRSDPLYKYAESYMIYHWGNKPGVFPGAQPVSIERRHFSTLSAQPYVVCEKTDGERAMMMCFIFEGKKVCVFVNRKMDMFVCDLNFRKKVYEGNGTILEGEIYEDTFMIYDALITFGKGVGSLDFIDRLANIEELMKLLTPLKTDAISLKIKTFHLLTDFDTFLNEYLPTVTQNTDGLIFTPVNTWVKMGTHETLFKWKAKDENTIDFQVKIDDTQHRLYIQERGKLLFESIIPPEEVPDWLEHDQIVECVFMGDYWKPIKHRKDKNFPNSKRTFYRTLVNIKEDIKIEEFLKFSTYT